MTGPSLVGGQENGESKKLNVGGLEERGDRTRKRGVSNYILHVSIASCTLRHTNAG